MVVLPAVAAEIVDTEIIGEDDDQIRPTGRGLSSTNGHDREHHLRPRVPDGVVDQVDEHSEQGIRVALGPEPFGRLPAARRGGRRAVGTTGHRHRDPRGPKTGAGLPDEEVILV